MFSFINKYLSYVVLAGVVALGGYMYVQNLHIASLKSTVETQKQEIVNQGNKIKSIESDLVGLKTIDSNRSDNRQDLDALKNKVGKLTENQAKSNPKVAETQLKEIVNSLMTDISEASK